MRNSVIILFFLLCTGCLFAENDLSLEFKGKAPTGLVGNGKILIKTAPDRFTAVKGITLTGTLQLEKNREKLLPSASPWNSSFFPGGMEYTIKIGRDSLAVMHGVTPEGGYTLCVQHPLNIKVSLDQSGPTPLVQQMIQEKGSCMTVFSQQTINNPQRYSEYKAAFIAPYTRQLVLESPNETLNKAVAFSQYLLDLGYDGNLMYCELYRWQDIWARDLGSGLLPGALISGRSAMARQSLEYDLKRYALMNPEDCKNSNDPSQGGTSSGIGWTARSAWNYYLYSGDLETLRKDAEIIRPWVKHWIQRDYDQDGLIIDVTEFMDHMIMMLTTNGVTTLAANSMYAGLLSNFSKIEAELGNKKEAAIYSQLYDRTVNAINTTYWNNEKGYFNNMMLWGTVSERSSQASQSMLLKIGATDEVRARKTLDYLKKTNWNPFGSITIVPKMNHVSLSNDQNVKVWPWWNLWETEARFKCNDKEGGYHLLDLAAQTIKNEKYPGLIEETLDTEGNTIGGNAFVTAAGNLLDVVVKDLLGIEVLKAGWKEIKVVPSVPDEWTTYKCVVSTHSGSLLVEYKDKQLSIRVNDPQIQYVHVDNMENVKVTGAEKKQYVRKVSAERRYEKPKKIAIPALKEGKTAVFYDQALHSVKPDLSLPCININELAGIHSSPYKKIIVPGNKLPLCTTDGKSIKQAIEKYMEKGGTVIFYGATTHPKSDEDGAGILGEQCGIIDWYQFLPAREKQPLQQWVFEPDKKSNLAQKNGKYTTHFSFSSSDKGKEVFIELGPLAGLDSVFVNGIPVANYTDMDKLLVAQYPTKTNYPNSHKYKKVSRIYSIKPNSEAYKSFRFGQPNEISVVLFNDGMNEGLPETNRPNIGFLTGSKEWQPTDESIPDMGLSAPKRKAVNYWGSEQFFNSWSTKNGLFGFSIEGKGVRFCENTPLAGLENATFPVTSAYTDFALFKPWNFQVLAYTETNQQLLYPEQPERYPCIARIMNTTSKGEFILIAPEIANTPLGKEVLDKLIVTDKNKKI